MQIARSLPGNILIAVGEIVRSWEMPGLHPCVSVTHSTTLISLKKTSFKFTLADHMGLRWN